MKPPASQPAAPYIHTSNSRINTSTLEETLRQITPEFPYTTDLCTLHTLPGCGFNSSSYFAQTFHRTFGCTPREYGRQNKRRQISHYPGIEP